MIELWQQIVNGLATGATYAVVALGFGLVFSVMRVLNLAHADIFTWGAYSAFVLLSVMSGTTVYPVVLLLLCFLAGAASGGIIGLAIERVVIRPLRGRDPLAVFLATAGVGIALRNLAQSVFGPDSVALPRVVPSMVFKIAGATITLAQLLVVVTALILMGLVSLYVRGTRLGLATRAVAEKPTIASSFGVNVNRVSQAAIGLASASAGAAGVSVAMLLGSALPEMGTFFGIKAFICVLVAGNRRLEGIMVVGLVLGVVEALVTGFVSSNFRDAISFGVLILVLFFRPAGVFGSYPESRG